MVDRPSADRTAELLLWFQREPSRYHAEGRRRDAPALDADVILKLALGRHVDFAAPALREPGTYFKLKQAAAAYVRAVFFRPDATPYQTLGLAPGASQEAIRESFRLLMHLVHPDRQGPSRQWSDGCAAQANRAYAVLRDPEARSRLEREAEARAAIARSIHRAASSVEASRMPVVIRPKQRRKSAGALAQRAMPEWLTAGVGGYVRRNPAVAAFAILLVSAALFVGTTAWQGHDGMLVREARAPRMADAAILESRTSPASASSVTATPVESSRASRPSSPEVAVPLPSFALERSSSPAAAESISSPAPAPSPPPELPASAPRDAAPVPPPAEPAVPVPAPVSVAAPAPVSVPAPAPVSAPVPPPPAAGPALATAEIEALFATLVETYERGRLDAFAALFDDDADTNLRHGRAAIRGEYDELFRLSNWRRMQLSRVNWKRVGDRTIAKGEILVKIGWRDGKEVEQRLNVDVELMRRDGRVVIARLMHQPKAP